MTMGATGEEVVSFSKLDGVSPGDEGDLRSKQRSVADGDAAEVEDRAALTHEDALA